MDRSITCAVSRGVLDALDRVLGYAVDCADKDEDIIKDIRCVDAWLGSVPEQKR